MRRVAFLGLGAMGRRMATRLVEVGYDVTVWSRSGAPADAPALASRFASSPRMAARDAEIVVSMVTDDPASIAVWDDPKTGALSGLPRGAIAIESSTLTPARVTALAARVRGAGADFLDAPVVGSRPAAASGNLVYLVGGDDAVVDRARPMLSVLGSTIHHVGPSPSGAIVKLMVNTLFGAQVVAMAEVLTLARRTGLEVGRAVEALGALPVTSPAAKAALAGMIEERFEPQFPVDLVAKDFDYACRAGGDLPLTTRVRDLFVEASRGGLGGANVTAIVRRFALDA